MSERKWQRYWINKDIGTGGDVLTEKLKVIRDEHTADMSRYFEVVEADAVRSLVKALKTLKEYHEVSKGEMHKTNFNWIIANNALASLPKELLE